MKNKILVLSGILFLLSSFCLMGLVDSYHTGYEKSKTCMTGVDGEDRPGDIVPPI